MAINQPANLKNMESVPLVVRVSDLSFKDLAELLSNYSLDLVNVEKDLQIPGSFWGESEAGLIKSSVYVRADTPIHSLLHESCHAICMPTERQENLDTDAGGDFDEENAVCYLQILLAEKLPGYSSTQCMQDMDEWGYTFRLGSAFRWFTEDASDARDWLATRLSKSQSLALLA